MSALRIVQRFKAGMSRSAIAKKYGISLERIDRAIRSYLKPAGR